MSRDVKRKPRPTASRLNPVDLADFLARKDLADFLHEVLLDFLAYSFAHSVNNILSYLKKTNLPIKYGVRSPKFIWAPCHVMCTAVLIG
jgi:hypothetical protein